MTHGEKRKLWRKYPDIWGMFEEFNGILQEDENAWKCLVAKTGEISKKYQLPVVDELLAATVYDLDKISRRRR